MKLVHILNVVVFVYFIGKRKTRMLNCLVIRMLEILHRLGIQVVVMAECF